MIFKIFNINFVSEVYTKSILDKHEVIREQHRANTAEPYTALTEC